MTEEVAARSKRCYSCGSDIPIANFELHFIRCANSGGTADTTSSSLLQNNHQYVGTILRQTLKFIFLCILLGFLGLFAKWKIDVHTDTTGFYDDDHPGFFANVTNLYFGNSLRKAYLRFIPQSFPSDPWSESTFDWNWAIDDFWVRTVRPPLKDASRLTIESSLTPEQAKKLQNDFISLTDRVEKLYWKALPWSKGVCGRQKDGSVCAVHRWNAYARKDRLVGRFQCWTDFSLSESNPSFVYWLPIFHSKFVEDGGFFCLVDVPGYAGTLAAPLSLPLFHMNDLLWYHPLDVEHHVQVRDGDSPADFLRREIQPFFFPMLESFAEDRGSSSIDNDDDEGELIDLDLEERIPQVENDAMEEL